MDQLDLARGAQPRLDEWHMARALELAERGAGTVEPNPLVGCVIARAAETIGEGWHRRFGAAHAEIDALAIAGTRARGSTLYVTLEPCCHYGKTPPCTQAVIAAGVARVVVATQDPFPDVAGGGIRELRKAGIEVDVGVCETAARQLIAPFEKLWISGRPWVIAKWAMTLDGRLASRNGSSQWISGEQSRQLVHALRGRVDAIMVGRGTAEQDDPLLTARLNDPQNSDAIAVAPRLATRIVVDTDARLSLDSQLVCTAHRAPLLVAVSDKADVQRTDRLTAAGCEVLVCPGASHAERLLALLDELGRRRMTNLLVEGGAGLLGSLFDLGQLDEVHAFIASKLIGGSGALSPLGGLGIAEMPNAQKLASIRWQSLDGDLHLNGRIVH